MTKALEIARRNKVIGHPLDACIEIYAKEELLVKLQELSAELPEILIVSQVKVIEGTDDNFASASYQSEEMPLAVNVVLATGQKCERCWIYSDTVGSDAEHSTLCKRCADVVKEM